MSTTTEHREKIRELALAVNDLLILYVEVHNGVLNQNWWRSIPLPGLFKPIDLDRYEIQISKAEEVLGDVYKHISELDTDVTLKDRAFVGLLHQYTAALIGAVAALATIVRRLHKKRDGQSYTLSEYYRDIALYKDAEKPYHALGADMNRMWQAFRNEQY